MTSELDSRKSFERDYYNKMVENSLNGNNISWNYGADSLERVFRTPYKYVEEKFLSDIEGKVVLDYYCGTGTFSIFPALRGAFVYGIDISDKSIEAAINRAGHFGVSNKTKFEVMDAENLEFGDNTFA